MVVMTAKLSKKKLIAAIVAIVALIVLIALCVKSGGGSPKPSAADANSERIAFLSSFGYTVNGEPAETGTVMIPAQPSEVFDRYNELQKSQGYDLSQYAGQKITRYVYALEDYDDTGTPWYATVLCADGEIIGGDVACTEPDGKMHGFERPVGQ